MSFATKMATKVAEKKLKSELKDMAPKPPAGSGPRLRTGKGVGDKVEGCCTRFCATFCRVSPWTQIICWAMVALVLATTILWLGGAFLVGPAKSNTASTACGINMTIPVLNKNPYVFYLGTTGIIVTIMIIASCLCCCSFAALCSSGCPKIMRICGCVGFIITLIAVSLYTGWVALGTYFVIKIHGGESICRNTIMYLVLLYVYLVVLTIASCVVSVWKCNDLRKDAGTHSGTMRKTRTLKKKASG